MDVSLRHWPIFVTGLLLGAAGMMALGLHRPTQAELAALSLPPASQVSVATPAAPAPVAPAGPDSAALEAERMLAAAAALRAQEALAAAQAPEAVAVVAAPKRKLRKIAQEALADGASAPAAAQVSRAIAIAPDPSDPVPLRASTSVMGASERVQAARGSAYGADAAQGRSPD